MKKHKHKWEFRGQPLWCMSLICQICECGLQRWFVGGAWKILP